MIVDISFKTKRPVERHENVTKVGVHEGIVWIHYFYNQEVYRILYKHIKLLNVTP